MDEVVAGRRGDGEADQTTAGSLPGNTPETPGGQDRPVGARPPGHGPQQGRGELVSAGGMSECHSPLHRPRPGLLFLPTTIKHFWRGQNNLRQVLFPHISLHISNSSDCLKV